MLHRHFSHAFALTRFNPSVDYRQQGISNGYHYLWWGTIVEGTIVGGILTRSAQSGAGLRSAQLTMHILEELLSRRLKISPPTAKVMETKLNFGHF